jgi:hypothetical protein
MIDKNPTHVMRTHTKEVTSPLPADAVLLGELYEGLMEKLGGL